MRPGQGRARDADTAVSLIWAPLSGFYGRKAVYLMSLPIFVVASIGVANSHSVGDIMATRVLQGIGGSSLLLAHLRPKLTTVRLELGTCMWRWYRRRYLCSRRAS